ncbi:hypothetical protein R3P38DRAFT_1842614 [Favolaschia claudopus]|uniref:Zn(2)-C6 fungal-type domain-containing protein n=1 Tax=Favolaschia claudopus TaxID=2862362 RepID=A0AAW0A2F8_9AGAR
MPSNNDGDHPKTHLLPSQGKKRRLQPACDYCRRRRTRCNGSQGTAQKCNRCAKANVSCTYVGADKKSISQPRYRRFDDKSTFKVGLIGSAKPSLKLPATASTLHHKPYLRGLTLIWDRVDVGGGA